MGADSRRLCDMHKRLRRNFGGFARTGRARAAATMVGHGAAARTTFVGRCTNPLDCATGGSRRRPAGGVERVVRRAIEREATGHAYGRTAGERLGSEQSD